MIVTVIQVGENLILVYVKANYVLCKGESKSSSAKTPPRVEEPVAEEQPNEWDQVEHSQIVGK